MARKTSIPAANLRWSQRLPLRFNEVALPADVVVSQVGLTRGSGWVWLSYGLDVDLIQISSLCKRMDMKGMPPLIASDLDPMVGRVVSQFADVINECNALLRKWEHADFSGLKPTPQKYGHGFYFTTISRCTPWIPKEPERFYD